MKARTIAETQVQQPQIQAAFRTIKLLLGGYFVISVLTLAAIFLLYNNTAIVTPAVFVRNSIVVIHAVITLLFAARTARGSRVGYIMLRLSSISMVVAIAVILAIPGDFPLWFKIEQGTCGLLLLSVVIVILDKQVRTVFAKQ